MSKEAAKPPSGASPDEKRAKPPAEGAPDEKRAKPPSGASPDEKRAKPPAERAPDEKRVITRLQELYKKDAVPALTQQFKYTNIMAVPRLVKINVNMGLGEAVANAKVLDVAAAELSAITGQRPVVTKAKKSIAAFKLRQGMPIGATVTLRGDRMYEFLDRLVSTALPRVRDFRGVSARAFDGRGNYTLGLRDQLIFPEIDYGKADKTRGMNITIVTSAKSDEEAFALLKLLGMPFTKT